MPDNNGPNISPALKETSLMAKTLESPPCGPNMFGLLFSTSFRIAREEEY